MIRHPSDSEMKQVIDLPSDLPAANDPQRWSEEFRAERLRTQWTWAAFHSSGDLLGRLALWGRDDSQSPVSLELLDVNADGPQRHDIAVSLLESAAREFAESPGGQLPGHEVVLPVGWRDDPALMRAVTWRLDALAAVGMTRHNERLQLAWDRSAPLPVQRDGLRFQPGSDEQFLTLFEAAARGSLDVWTRMDLRTMSAPEQAAADFEFYRDCPGERSWWRVAVDEQGNTVGFVIPSATPYHRNVGYLAVLPEFRGRGLVDDLLGYATRFHAVEGAARITATTDTVNHPMAAAFARAGYAVTEIRYAVSTD